jgi:hypothetical protein
LQSGCDASNSDRRTRSRLHSETTANLLSRIGPDFSVFSERALID